MIVSKAPFRISFAGGGSDLKSFYKRNQYGAVISSSIDKYMYLILHSYFEDRIRIKYSELEDVSCIDDIKHPIVRESLKRHNIGTGIEIASIADVPAGTGIGSSSSFTVALTKALYENSNKKLTKEEIAEIACSIEIDILQEPIGKQDQYAATFGGLNYIRFNKDGTVIVEPIKLSSRNLSTLNKRLVMFYSGISRSASAILEEQNELMSNTHSIKIIQNMVSLCEDLKIDLMSGSIDSIGDNLNAGWELKRAMSSRISSLDIDKYYSKAIEAGAVGGKLLGAGGGGFFLFYCHEDKQKDLVESMGLKELQFNLSNEGVKAYRI